MSLRDYRSADREACLAVFETNVPAFFAAGERDEFAAFLDALPGPFFVLTDRATGSISACGGYAIAPDQGVATLCWGMVRRELHGQGLGSLLLVERLSRIYARANLAEVRLNTSQFSRSFFERHGFRTRSVVSDGYGPGLDRCEMHLPLSR